MVQSQPPFSALRALEAATRHRSFTRAAQELRVTHSAVSQAVRRLEADMGARLFDRRGGAMEPSEAALKLAQSYSAAAEQLSGLIREIRGDDTASRVTMRMPPEVARLWMTGREGRLSESMPDIEVILSGEFDRGDVELLSTLNPRSSDQYLGAVVLTPMAAPSILEAYALKTPGEILRAPLLADRLDGWSAWAARHVPGARPRPRVIRDRRKLLEAALAGSGVILGDQLTAHLNLTPGALLQLPFPIENGQHLALRSYGGPNQAAPIDRLAMWLKLELARDAAMVRKCAVRP